MLDLSARQAVSNDGLFSGPRIEVGEALSDIDQSYRELRPLFFLALGKLARQGFVTSPADGLDLIHDFFADEWEKVSRTYKPSRGSYRTYAYQSFVQFVRPRIVRIQRFQNYRLRPDEMESALKEPAATSPSPEVSYDHQLVRGRIAELPELQRAILTEYVYSEKSERALAQAFSVSRHRLRELLVEGLGRVLVRLERPKAISLVDWQVALALWRDARSISQTAKYLHLTEHQVRSANARNFKFLTHVLSVYHPHGNTRRQEMAKTDVALRPRELFKKTILSPGNEALLNEIAQRAEEIMNSLDDPEAMDMTEEEMRSLHPEWIARVYEALAPAGEEEEALEISDKLGYAHAGAEYEVGQAYEQSLIPGLPPHLADLPRWLSSLPEVDDNERRDLLETPSARGAESLSPDLARYGVTPLTVLDATNAVSRLLQRYLRTERLTEPIILSHHGVNDGEVLNAEHLADEVSQVAVCREPTARVLLDWSIEVAHIKFLLFDTFVAETAGGESLRLIYNGEKQPDLHKRWGLSSREMN